MIQTTTRYLLLRHGQIAANRRGRWHGSTDSPLTQRGRRQAKRTARHLAANDAIDLIYTSPLQRCRDTADAVGRALDTRIVIKEGFEEMSIGEWEDLSFRELAKKHNFVARTTADPDFSAPAGESLNDVSSRVTRAMSEVDADHAADETVLIVSHGVTLAVLLAQLLHETPTRWTDFHFDNCSLTELILTPQPALHRFNHSAHL